MIISYLDKNTLKIIIDEVDLKNAGIKLEKWISNSNQTSFFIKNLLTSNFSFYENIILKDYLIFTYNYKVFSITLKT